MTRPLYPPSASSRTPAYERRYEDGTRSAWALLQAGFADLPRSRRHTILDLPSLTEAVIVTVDAIHGRTVHCASPTNAIPQWPGGTQIDDRTLLTYRLDDIPGLEPFPHTSPTSQRPRDIVGLVYVKPGDTAHWKDYGRAPYSKRERRAGHQTLLNVTFAEAWTYPDTARVAISNPFDGGDPRTMQAAAMVWWESRMIEGYTPEAARTMFALLAHPDAQALVDLSGVTPRPKPVA